MLPADCIAKLLDMEHLEVINIEHKAGEIMLEVRMKRMQGEATTAPGIRSVAFVRAIPFAMKRLSTVCRYG